MKNIFKKIGGLCLGLAMLSGVALNVNLNRIFPVEAAVGDTVLGWAASGFGTTYGTKTGTTGNKTWVLTCGGNSSSIGINSKNFSKTTLGDTYSKYGTPCSIESSTTGVSAFATTSSLSNVGKIKLEGSQAKGSTQKVYLIYSLNNTTFNKLTLTSGSQGASYSNESTFEFATCSGYFGVVYQTTATTGDWRIDSAKITFYEGSTEPQKEVKTISITGNLSKTDYTTDDTWSNSGLVVTATYDDDSTENVTSKSSWTYEPEKPVYGTTNVKVTATFGEKSNYINCDVSVTAAKGSENNPYSADEAYEECSKLTSGKNNGKNVFVTGIAKDNPTFNSNKQGTFNIIVSSNRELKAYKLENMSESSAEAGYVGVGYIVLVEGYLINYNGTYEIGYANGATSRLISSTAPTADDPTGIIINNKSSLPTTIPATFSQKISASVQPLTALQAVEFSSSNTDYATIDSTGLITTLNAGVGMSVTITAKVKDYTFTDTYTFSITRTPKYIDLYYGNDSTTNMTADNNASSVNLNEEKWSVLATPTGASVPLYPGLNSNKYIALYYNSTKSNEISISTSDINIEKIQAIQIDFVSDLYSNVGVYVASEKQTLTSGLYNIQAKSFVLKNENSSNVQVRITNIRMYIEYITEVQESFDFEDDYILSPGGTLIEYPETIPTGIEGNNCLPTELGGKNYYLNAKSAYYLLDSSVKNAFSTLEEFKNARDRFTAWALANGETIDFQTGVSSAKTQSFINIINTTEKTWIIVAVSLTGLTAIGGYFFYKKRKENI